MKNVLIIVWLIAICTCTVESTQDLNKPVLGVLGTGYVGLVTGAGLAEIGNTVICADIVKEKIDALKQGIIPIYEPGLDTLVAKNVGEGRLSFTHDIAGTIAISDVIFIAVGTPMLEDGSADMSSFKAVIEAIADNLNGYKIIVTKSTVPIGTGSWIRSLFNERMIDDVLYDFASNPEFLREGVAVDDFLSPDRIVIGSESDNVKNVMRSIYQPMLDRNVPIVFTDIATAETIKYASNALLAIKISFMNEMSNLCGALGAKIYTVARAMGLDKRIGPLFLNPGPGFGGSCFPKDCHELVHMGQKYGVDMHVVQAALDANEAQKEVAVKKLSSLVRTSLRDKTIAILGLAFKANTDDIRYSSAITAIKMLLDLGAHVQAYDPAATENMKRLFPDIVYCSSPYDAVVAADACIVLTEWAEFKALDLEKIASLMHAKIVVDMRGILDCNRLKTLEFIYDTIGT